LCSGTSAIEVPSPIRSVQPAIQPRVTSASYVLPYGFTASGPTTMCSVVQTESNPSSSARSAGAADPVGRRPRAEVRQDHAEVHDPRLTSARVARLATTGPDGRPHLVPIVFALDGDTLYSAVDRKPKRSRTLRRLENARLRPDVTILVDHYEERWSGLWWIRLRGRARVLDEGAECERALELLAAKYPQYVAEPPNGPVLAVDVSEVREWTATPG
jgi:PPOX class probable F420-dependent enzyme